MSFFLKDYKVYGISTVVLVTLYIGLMISFVSCCKAYAGLNSGPSLLVYNVIVSINAVYAMFKPMQYYHKTVDNTNGAICEIDSINETWEGIIGACVYTSLIFVLCQWIVGVFGCLITRNRIKNPSDGGVESTYCIKNAYYKCEKLVMALAVALALFFYVSLLYVSSQMIKHRVSGDRSKDDVWKIIVIIVVDVLSIFSVIDIFFCEFCNDTRKNYCRNCCEKTEDLNVQRRYQDLFKDSRENENAFAYSLQMQNSSEL